MRGPLPAKGFSELVGVSVERLDEYRAAGLLDPEGDGLFDDFDVLRVALLAPFEDRGHTAEEIATQVGNEEHSMIHRIFRLGGDSYTLAEAAEQMGVTVQQAEDLALAMGFPTDAPLDRTDIEHFGRTKALLDAGLPWESVIEGARVFS
ncbi:MAG: hypothetical protein ACRDI3_06140, partial [Actinomycetota bacterium]